MPLISLGLASVEEQAGLPLWSIGNRSRVGSEQAAFWRREAAGIIQAYSMWFADVHRDRQRLAFAWEAISDSEHWGGHRDRLPWPDHEFVTPPAVADLITDLLAQFREWQPTSSGSAAAVRSSSTPSQQRASIPCQSRDAKFGPVHARSLTTAEKDSTVKQAIIEAVRQHPLPPHWKMATSKSGEVYYWNWHTNVTTWSHPLEDVINEIVVALRDCLAVSSGSKMRQERLSFWARKWHDMACQELAMWRSVAAGPTTAAYFYRLPDKGSQVDKGTCTWEDPRQCQDSRLRCKVDILASLLALPTLDIAGAKAQASLGGFSNQGQESLVEGGRQRHCHAENLVSIKPSPAGRQATHASGPHGSNNLEDPVKVVTMRTKDGRVFDVEPLPADHSCGFHGLSISRQDAARLLRKNRGDSDVMEYVAADLANAVQICERERFPPTIGNDARLWRALSSYYATQQELDAQRRHSRDLLRASRDASTAAALEAAGGDILEAVQSLLVTIKEEAKQTPSGPHKLQLMHRVMDCKGQSKALLAAAEANTQAESELRYLCRTHFDDYVEWIGRDMSFWLSFVRGIAGERVGGLLDALAKAQGLTVRVWAEAAISRGDYGAHRNAASELELVHEAKYGGAEVNLWYQGQRGHFDRLVPRKSK